MVNNNLSRSNETISFDASHILSETIRHNDNIAGNDPGGKAPTTANGVHTYSYLQIVKKTRGMVHTCLDGVVLCCVVWAEKYDVFFFLNFAVSKSKSTVTLFSKMI